MLKLHYRKGFPAEYRGQVSLDVFEVMLDDGTTREATVSRVGGLHKEDIMAWRDRTTDGVIPEEKVLGWRETYNCGAAQQDIDTYFRHPSSVVAKNYLADAFRRHIERESCLTCKIFYNNKASLYQL